MSAEERGIDYRCRSCGTIVVPRTHHKLEACRCGKVLVDRGWYGSRVLWPGGNYSDHVEALPKQKASQSRLEK